MKTLSLTQPNKFYLDAPNTNAEGLSVALRLIGESGEALKSSAGDELIFNTPEFDTDKRKYFVQFTFLAGTAKQYARAFWKVIGEDEPITIDGYYPQDVEIVQSEGTFAAQVVPVGYFIDFIAAEETLDDNFTAAIAIYAKRGNMGKDLLAAQGNLERATRLTFFQQKASMERDFFAQEFRDEYWLQQTDYRPIVSVDSYKLIYGAQAVELSQNIANQMVVDHKMGTIEFLPTVLAGNLFTILASTISAMGATLVAGGGHSRVPVLFRVEYTHGLDFPRQAENEKESIRAAICRNALRLVLPRIDPSMRFTSNSNSIDGASFSQSSNVPNILKSYEEDEKKWIAEMKSRYITDFNIAVL